MRKNNNEKKLVLLYLIFPILSLLLMYGSIKNNRTSTAVMAFLITIFDLFLILYVYRKIPKYSEDNANQDKNGKRKKINKDVINKVKDFMLSQIIEPLNDNTYYVIFNNKHNVYAGWYVPDLNQECFKQACWIGEDLDYTIIEYFENIERVEKALCELVQYENVNLDNISIKQKSLPERQHSCYRNSHPDEFQ